MTGRELLKKAEELELIARELRAMAYSEGLATAEPPPPGGTQQADNTGEAKADRRQPKGV